MIRAVILLQYKILKIKFNSILLKLILKTNHMSSAVIDIQCVLGVNNKYMIKNISIVNTEKWATLLLNTG